MQFKCGGPIRNPLEDRFLNSLCDRRHFAALTGNGVVQSQRSSGQWDVAECVLRDSHVLPLITAVLPW